MQFPASQGDIKKEPIFPFLLILYSLQLSLNVVLLKYVLLLSRPLAVTNHTPCSV